jgi:hypothetical protein
MFLCLFFPPVIALIPGGRNKRQEQKDETANSNQFVSVIIHSVFGDGGNFAL